MFEAFRGTPRENQQVITQLLHYLVVLVKQCMASSLYIVVRLCSKHPKILNVVHKASYTEHSQIVWQD